MYCDNAVLSLLYKMLEKNEDIDFNNSKSDPIFTIVINVLVQYFICLLYYIIL